VVLFAHGYVSVTEPLDYANLDIGGVYLPVLLQQLGYALATTTYRQNGLVISEGVEDMRLLRERFGAATGRRGGRFILVGVSQGGIIALLAAERYPAWYDGALVLCGPVGSFRLQSDYIHDIRVLFDAYFPGILPGDARSIPPSMMAAWEAVHLPAIRAAVEAAPARAEEMLRVAGAAFEPGDLATVLNTFEQTLWYHTFGGMDAQQKLGGFPFDNRTRRYRGSSDDGALNAAVARYAADRAAVRVAWQYRPSGRPDIPVVALHTTGDEVVPYRHLLTLFARTRVTGSTAIDFYPIDRYGHCAFTPGELIGGLVRLLARMH
jgi:pimeloyl-ACP methyl ester carboxylesterase